MSQQIEVLLLMSMGLVTGFGLSLVGQILLVHPAGLRDVRKFKLARWRDLELAIALVIILLASMITPSPAGTATFFAGIFLFRAVQYSRYLKSPLKELRGNAPHNLFSHKHIRLSALTMIGIMLSNALLMVLFYPFR